MVGPETQHSGLSTQDYKNFGGPKLSAFFGVSVMADELNQYEAMFLFPAGAATDLQAALDRVRSIICSSTTPNG